MDKNFMIFILVLNILISVALSMPPQSKMKTASEKPEDGKVQSDSTLEDLVKTDISAYTIWNIAKEYNITLSPHKCQTELEKNPEIIRFLIVKLSIEETEQHLRFYPFYDSYYTGNSLKYAFMLYEKRTNVTKNHELYLRTVEHIAETGSEKNEMICASSSNSTSCGCFAKYAKSDNEEVFTEFKNDNAYLWEFITFGSYVDPMFRIIIMIAGLTVNGVLLFVFMNEKTVRTESNIMIFNLIVNNIFMLIFYLPTNYITIYHIYNYRESKFELFLSPQVFVVSANAVIILLINVQRYFDVSRITNTNGANTRLSAKHRCIIYSSITWVFSSVVAIFFLFLNPYNAPTIQILIYFLVYIFIFSIVMAVFNSMTARKFQRFSEQGQTSSEIEKLTGSAVILHLTFVYYVTHLLYYIYSIFEGTFFDSGAEYFSPTSIRIIILILHLIFFSYPSFTVLALYKSSGTYRSFLKFYLFRCWYNPEEGQYVTMNTGENSDGQRLCA